MVEWLGSKSEADTLTMEEVAEIAEHWNEEPPAAACLRRLAGVGPQEQTEQQMGSLDAPLGPELTLEQYEALVAGMKANAAQFGVRKHGG